MAEEEVEDLEGVGAALVAEEMEVGAVVVVVAEEVALVVVEVVAVDPVVVVVPVGEEGKFVFFVLQHPVPPPTC